MCRTDEKKSLNRKLSVSSELGTIETLFVSNYENTA